MMKNITGILACLIIFASAGCKGMQSTYRNVPDEMTSRIITDSVDTLGMDYGYNSKLETLYFYFINDTDPAQVKGDKELAGVLDKYNEKDVLNAYIEIFKVNEAHQYLLSFYQKRKVWIQYNYIRREMVTPSKIYMNKVDDYVRVKYPKSYTELSAKKAEIRKNEILMFQEKFTLVDEYY